MMADNICTRCNASLTEGYCEYCGWNSPKTIEDKTLTLSGILCDLTVEKEICTFVQKVGAPVTIRNNEISQISLSQAPMVGTGELSLYTITGITQKITFLYPQNPNMGEIASYLLHIAPEAQFTSTPQKDNTNDLSGVACPKCNSTNTKMTGESRKFSIWKIILGALLTILGISVTTGPIAFRILIIIGGVALLAFGLRLVGKKKADCLCMDCRKRFRL